MTADETMARLEQRMWRLLRVIGECEALKSGDHWMWDSEARRVAQTWLMLKEQSDRK